MLDEGLLCSRNQLVCYLVTNSICIFTPKLASYYTDAACGGHAPPLLRGRTVLLAH